MSYLTGKRVKTLDGNKTGVIVSETFRERWTTDERYEPPDDMKTFVSVLWDDGSMESAVDIEELKIVERDVAPIAFGDNPIVDILNKQ